MKRGQRSHAQKNLSKLRKLPEDDVYILHELNAIEHQLHEEEEATLGQGAWGYVREIFTMRDNLYRV